MQDSKYYKKNLRGFTLIEIMAVLIVIGVAAAALTLSMGDGTRPQHVKASSRLLFDTLNLAAEEAVSGNIILGLRLDVNKSAEVDGYSYRWLRFDEESKEWVEPQIEGLEEKILPDFVHLEVEIEGQKIVIGTHKQEEKMFKVKIDIDADKKKKKKLALLPDLYFLSSGEMQNFKISIADVNTKDNRYTITGDALGQLNYERPEEKQK